MSEHSTEPGQPQGIEGTLEAGVSGDAEPEQDLQPGTVTDPDDTRAGIREATEASEGGTGGSQT